MGTVDANGTLEYTFASAAVVYKGDEASILAKPSTGWDYRVAKIYQEDKGNASVALPENVEYDAEYIIYADLKDLVKGDEVPWKFIKK